MIYNFKRFSRAGITACLGLLKVLKDMRGPVPVEVFANVFREVSASYTNAARITACTGKLVNNIRTKINWHRVLHTKYVMDLEGRKG